MRKQIFNPYLPSYEYIPDGEPHVFGERLYIFGSHDRFGGETYCENDYVCWSASVNDLSDWRYDGVIYKKQQDPEWTPGKYLYAPDVCRGTDGRYYLYYCLLDCETISVAVCDTPAGEYQFYGHVSLPSGRPYGRRKDDYYMFDPAVLVEGSKVYLYVGFHLPFLKTVKGHPAGAVVIELHSDMKTINDGPKVIMPASNRELGLHSFFEASSIRKFGDYYYYIYSSNWSHELCYCMSKFPDRDFVYKGVLHSNGDIGIGKKRFRDRTYPSGNNHGSIEKIGNEFYVFGHRHTNNNGHTRQGVAEKLIQNSDGTFQQAEMTSCGLNGGPLMGAGEYPAYIAHHLTGKGKHRPYITQDGADETQCSQYIKNVGNGAVVGFRYFTLRSPQGIHVTLRGNATGTIFVRMSPNGAPIGKVELIGSSQSVQTVLCKIQEPLEMAAAEIYFSFSGKGIFDFIKLKWE